MANGDGMDYYGIFENCYCSIAAMFSSCSKRGKKEEATTDTEMIQMKAIQRTVTTNKIMWNAHTISFQNIQRSTIQQPNNHLIIII